MASASLLFEKVALLYPLGLRSFFQYSSVDRRRRVKTHDDHKNVRLFDSFVLFVHPDIVDDCIRIIDLEIGVCHKPDTIRFLSNILERLGVQRELHRGRRRLESARSGENERPYNERHRGRQQAS